MNIFVTDVCPVKSAKYLDDKRVIKMVLESAQMLCTAINIRGGITKKQSGKRKDGKPKHEYFFNWNSKRAYAPTHVNHPANVWARENSANYMWLCNHFIALCEEYTARYGKTHKCSELTNDLIHGVYLMSEGALTEFANCAAHGALGLNFKNVSPTTSAYKLYLDSRWKTDVRKPTWYRNAK
jgi:hypothetical protein